MNKKIINRQKNIKKNLKGFLYLFMVFVGPQVNSMDNWRVEEDKKEMLSYENKLKNINESQITKEGLEFIKNYSYPSFTSEEDREKIKKIQQQAKKISDNLDKNWPLSFYKLNLVEVGEVPDPADPNKKIKKTVVKESLNGKLISTLVIVPSFIAGLLYTFMKKKPSNPKSSNPESSNPEMSRTFDVINNEE